MKKKWIIALLVMLALLTAASAWAYQTSVPVMDYMPQSEWKSVSFYTVREAAIIPRGVFTEPGNGFVIWYEYPYHPDNMQIGFYEEFIQRIAPEEMREVLEKHRLWYADDEFFKPEYLFIITPVNNIPRANNMWWLGVSRGEYLILLPKGEETIFHFRDDGSLYRALMKLVEQSE